MNKPVTTKFVGYTLVTSSIAGELVVDDQLMSQAEANTRLAMLPDAERLHAAVMPITLECTTENIRDWMLAILENRDGLTHETTIKKLIALIRESN